VHVYNTLIMRNCRTGCPLPRHCGKEDLPKGKFVLYNRRFMFRIFRKLAANRNLIKNLVLRDLKHRYVGSMGGFLWSVIHPVVLLVSYTFVFTVIFRHELGPEYGTSNFPIFLFCGILPWLLFQDTVIRNCSVITDNAPLITKTIIPAEILPISITISNLIHHLIGMAILLTAMMIFYNIHLSALWILLYMPMLLMLAQGLGWIVAGLHVFLRDTIQALQILMFLWFWFTPVLYPIEGVPENLRFLFRFNPVATIVTGYRSSLLQLTQPALTQTAIVMVVSIAVSVLGGLLFKQTKPAFPDVL
jgi:lipopolysaccharide transport system permease protein